MAAPVPRRGSVPSKGRRPTLTPGRDSPKGLHSGGWTIDGNAASAAVAAANGFILSEIVPDGAVLDGKPADERIYHWVGVPSADTDPGKP
jgi:hypothetical protein